MDNDKERRHWTLNDGIKYLLGLGPEPFSTPEPPSTEEADR